MRKMPIKIITLGVVVALAFTMIVALGACGDGDTDDTGATDTTESTDTSSSGDTTVINESAVPGQVKLNFSELESSWSEFVEGYSRWTDIRYESVVEHFGTEGVKVESAGTRIAEYHWFASDSGALIITFDEASGRYLESKTDASAKP
ncbi:MAG: hypothetical protein FWE41_05385 [Coriobacteriia bacterium]|nr:hypothetical protein [Coriobacteriia bacterium]MCL2749422.1 hypothetical protein [Coriobacteriia bacterium]